MMDKSSLDLAPLGAKTKDMYKWKEEELKVGDVVDAYDRSIWNKSTILDMQDVFVNENRKYKSCYVAFRIYTEKGTR